MTDSNKGDKYNECDKGEIYNKSDTWDKLEIFK